MRRLALLCLLAACSHAQVDPGVRKDVACTTDRDCPGTLCRGGTCDAPAAKVRCVRDEECPAGQDCANGACAPSRAPPEGPANPMR